MTNQYNNTFIKCLFENCKIIDKFNLTDEFYKQFVRRNRKDGFMLYMLSGLRDSVNSILDLLRPYEQSIIGAFLVGYNDYNVVYISVITTERIGIQKKQRGIRYSFVKNMLITDNSILIQISINKYLAEKQ